MRSTRSSLLAAVALTAALSAVPEAVESPWSYSNPGRSKAPHPKSSGSHKANARKAKKRNRK